MRAIRRLWYNLCMSVALRVIRWAGSDPDEGRLEELLSRSDLSPKEKDELKRLLSGADVVIMG